MNDSSKKQRIQFDLTAEALEALDGLKDLSQATTRAELLKNSLRLFAWFLQKRLDGYDILLRKGSEIEKIEIPLFVLPRKSSAG